MADQALQRRSRDLIGVAVEGQLHGAGFSGNIENK
jgi:hypothetical protein